MDLNEYLLEFLARNRLDEMRAARAHWSRVDAAGPAERPLRVALGHALIRLGERLQAVSGAIDGSGRGARDAVRG